MSLVMDREEKKQDENNSRPESSNDTGNKKFTFRFKIRTRTFAQKYGIELPDDSMDVVLTGSSDMQDSKDSVAEDAAVSYSDETQKYDPNSQLYNNGGRKPCKTPIEKCTAKNPMTCRYHGARLIAEDIEGFLKNKGINSPVTVTLDDVFVDKKTGEESIICTAVVTAQSSDSDKINEALEEFFKSPGVDDSGIDEYENKNGEIDYTSSFMIDMLDPKANALWGRTSKRLPWVEEEQNQDNEKKEEEKKEEKVENEDSPSVNNEKKAQAEEKEEEVDEDFYDEEEYDDENVLFPELPPNAPPKPTFTQEELDFIQKMKTRIGKSIRHINQNIIDGTTWGDKNGQFDKIDVSKLDSLIQKDGSLSTLKDWYDKMKESKDAGYTKPVIEDKYDKDKDCDPSWYPGKQKKGYLDMSDLKFDNEKYAKEIEVFNEYEKSKENSPSNIREQEITVCNEVLNSHEKDAPTKEAKICIDAHKEMETLENAFSEIHNFPSAIRGMMEKKIGKLYYNASEQYKKCQKNILPKIQEWSSNQSVMSKGLDLSGLYDKMKRLGKWFPSFFKNAQNTLNKRIKEAENALQTEINSLKGGIKEAQENVESNISLLWESDDCNIRLNKNLSEFMYLFHDPREGTTYGRYQSPHIDYDYVALGQYNFGHSYSDTREQHKYLSFYPNETGFHNGNRCLSCYGDMQVEFDKKKIIGVIAGPHSNTRGSGYGGKCVILPTKPNITAYWPKLVKKYKSGRDVLDNALTQNYSGYTRPAEFWAIGDLTRDMIKRVHCSSYSQINALKNHPDIQKFFHNNKIPLCYAGKEYFI